MELSGEIQDYIEDPWGWEPSIQNGANLPRRILYTNSKSSLILSYFLFVFSNKGKLCLLWNGVFVCSLVCSALTWRIHIIHLWLFPCGCLWTSWELNMCNNILLLIKTRNQSLLWLKPVVDAKKLPL